MKYKLFGMILFLSIFMILGCSKQDFMGVYKTEKLFSDEYATFEEAWNDFDKQLEQAGIDRVISEINRQRNEIEKRLGK